MPGFRYYLHYIQQYSNILTTIEYLQTQNGQFRKTLKMCMSKVVDRDLTTLLSSVLNQLPFYSSCLENILKQCLPSNPEYINFANCVKQIKQITTEANRLVRRTRQKEQAKQVQNSLDGLGEMLATPNRRLIYQSNINELILATGEIKSRICFLFNDLLVVAKTKPNGRRNFKYRIHLVSANVCQLAADQLPNGFVLIDHMNRERYFQTEAESIYRRWIHYIREIVNESQFIPVTYLNGLKQLLSFPLSANSRRATDKNTRTLRPAVSFINQILTTRNLKSSTKNANNTWDTESRKRLDTL
ncbi:hypothetical protein BDF19DRAFT_226689 [Syncephalis fuscata]|nr:hypothetical protein BDF19DRAFT_226689 [Syncephalis fuscata]